MENKGSISQHRHFAPIEMAIADSTIAWMVRIASRALSEKLGSVLRTPCYGVRVRSLRLFKRGISRGDAQVISVAVAERPTFKP
ncbi:hypothetical protein FOZ63_004016 [Perkinsus olseni]|uniref:Uncharacterized protein n=1 Tax=Perkinsus olseni TaxID=32597 RepID=A0A7J6NCM0_PEROL|nr:hypothetical protein FOZ63_004016 [Perkinsus olseni]